MALKPITLVKPLVTHNGPVTVLQLKDPLALYVFKLGLPYDMSQRPPIPSPPLLLEYLKLMTPYDMGVMEQLCIQDQLAVMAEIINLFDPGSAENPTPPPSPSS